MTRETSSWVRKAGYVGLRRRCDWLIVAGAIPFLWFLAHRDFVSAGFGLATVLLVSVPVATTAWAAVRLRCTACGIPVYAMWLVGLPGKTRLSFEALPSCPYCLDDGTGATGDAARVDHRRETRTATRKLVFGLALFVGLLGAAFVLGVTGWLPGY